MLPLTYINAGCSARIIRLSGKPETKSHLEDMGFVPGAVVTVVSEAQGNIIINIKETRVAIGKEMANKISVEEVTEDSEPAGSFAAQH